MATSDTSGQVEPLPQQVDADEHVELAEAQVAHDLDPLDGVDVGVEIAHPHAQLEEIVGEVFGHLLGQRRDQDAIALRHPAVDLLQQIVDLALGRLDDDFGVDEARRPHDLLDHLLRDLDLVGARCRREKHHLGHALDELVEAQRAVVGRGRQPEAVLDEHLLAAAVALVLAVELGHGHVALVDDDEEVLREVVEQRVGRFARAATVDRTRVVLDAVAVADLLHHLEVVLRAHAQPLGLEQLALALEVGEPLLQLGLDAHDGLLHPLFAGDVVRGREHDELLERLHALARERIDDGDLLDLVAEQLDAHGRLVVRRVDLDGVAADAEGAAHEVHVVAVVVHVDELAQDRPLVSLLPGLRTR